MLGKLVLLSVPALSTASTPNLTSNSTTESAQVTTITTTKVSNCACKFQGSHLDAGVYNNYPAEDPGKYNGSNATKIYGTTCAAWDQMPETPWYSYCPSNASWAEMDTNWCQQPWCYVDASCESGVASSVFKGSSIAFYSYLACGSTADCYTGIAWNASASWPAGCPYDPHSTKSYKTHKGGNCTCKFHGQALSSDIYLTYPSETPGKYKDLAPIEFYGTTCAAWDQVPETPWASYCPANADWCDSKYNWCQAPWCYVASSCSTSVSSSVFKGSAVAHFSYDTCLSTPDCYTDVAFNETHGETNAPTECPFDSTDNGWYTSKKCTASWGTTPQTTGAPETSDTSGVQWMSMMNLLVMFVPLVVAGRVV